jgi:hypothetical protein
VRKPSCNEPALPLPLARVISDTSLYLESHFDDIMLRTTSGSGLRVKFRVEMALGPLSGGKAG